MRTTPDKFYDSGVQDWSRDVVKGVTESMMEAGARGDSRVVAGLKSYFQQKMRSPWTKKGKDEYTEQAKAWEYASNALRLFGKQRQAEWIDRFTVSKYKTGGKVGTSGGEKQPDDVSNTMSVMNKRVMREIHLQTGMLIRIDKGVNLVAATLASVSDDVSDIKKMLMPIDVMVKGKILKDEWGREDRSNAGKAEYYRYNPLAPAGSQFLKKAPIRYPGGWEDYAHSNKVTREGPGPAFAEQAARSAAFQTATLMLKIQKKDERKAELKKKQAAGLAGYLDPKERKLFDKDPILLLRQDMNDNFDKVFEMLKGKVGGKKSWIERILDFFAHWGPLVLPFLKGALRLFGRMSAIGLAAWLGYELGKWLNEKFKISEKLVDAVFAIKDWWQGLDIKGMLGGWKDEISNKLSMWKDELSSMWNKVLEFFGFKTEPAPTATPRGGAYSDLSLRELQEQKRGLEESFDRSENQAMRDFLNKQINATNDAIRAKQGKGQEPGITGRIYRPGNKTQVKDAIIAAAKKVGVDPGTQLAIAERESNFDTKATNKVSGAAGLYQFMPETWAAIKKKYGGEYPELDKGPYDLEAAAIAGALLTKENVSNLKSAGVGNAEDAGTAYSAHFMGVGALKKLRGANDYEDASKLFPREARQNPSIFFDKNGRGRTVGEVERILYDMVQGRADDYTAQLNPTLPSPRMVANGAEVDTVSREITTSRSPSAVVQTLAPMVVNKTLPVAQAAPVAALPRASALTSDPSLLSVASMDRVHPVG